VGEAVTFEVRAASAADAPGIRRLFARVFGTELSQEDWRWKFELSPDGWYGVVGIVDGEIVGNYSGWGMRFLLDGSSTLLYSIGDVATDPSVRGLGGRRGVYREMTEAFYETVRRAGVPFCFGFPNPRALRVSERLAGTRTLFPIQLLEVPMEVFPPPPSDGGMGDFVDESFDALWEAARQGLSHAVVRDRARVNWRFHGRPNRYYPMVWRKQAGAMTAWAALSVAGPSAMVVDFLLREPDGRDFPELLAVAAEEARRLGARQLVLWSSPGGPGRAAMAALPGPRRDADFPMIARVFDEGVVRRFAENVQLVPSLYDVV
jgi:hypothetical protein